MNQYISRALLGLLMFLYAGLSWGANPVPGDPGAVMERDIQQRLINEQERRIEEQQMLIQDQEPILDETKEPEKKPVKGGEAKLNVKHIAVTESDILSEQEIRTIVGPLEGRRVSLQDIFDAVEAINALYSEKNHIAARAILPPQKVKQGVVHIRLIEGRIGSISIENNLSTDGAFITERLDSEPGKLVEISLLEKDLFYFNTINDIQLRAVLKPGEIAGTTDYVLHAIEPERYDAYFFLDNAGSRDVGRERLGFSFTDRSLTGERDSLLFGAHIAEGTRSAYLAYNRPVSRKGTRLSFSVDYSDISIVDGPLEPLNVTGDSYNIGLFATYPMIVSRDMLLNGFGGFNIKRSTTDFDGVTLFDTKVRTISLGIDAQSFNADGSWYTRHFISAGLDEWGNTKDFLKYNGEGSWLHIFPDNRTLSLRGRAQLANRDLLPASEQFQVGGMSTVRGYREGLLIGDDGYFISIEYNFPITSDNDGSLGNPFTDRWRGFVFFDQGAAFPFKGNDESINRDDFLASIGFGLTINLGKKLKGRLVAGVPLISRDDNEDDPTLHFYLQSMPF